MTNRYLEILQLQPGASLADVKAAYRRLSKMYHPDISKDPMAKEKFIEIHEAYNFLTRVGPAPNQERVSYSYDPEESAYEKWRREARERARRKAYEEARMQQELIRQILKTFDYAFYFITIFNAILLLDYLLPRQAHEERILGSRETDKFTIRRTDDAKYDELLFENFKMKFKSSEVIYLDAEEQAVVYATVLLRQPTSVVLTVNGAPERHYQTISVYAGFGWLIPFLLLLALAYKYLANTLDTKLTLAVFLAFFVLIQVYVFSAH